MADLDLATIEHALEVARAKGFAEVELCMGSDSFSAKLDPAPRARSKSPSATPADIAEHDHLLPIKAGQVGYLGAGPVSLQKGVTVTQGDVVAVISALGISNDVESPVSGEIVEVLLNEGDPVEYGQAIALVKEST